MWKTFVTQYIYAGNSAIESRLTQQDFILNSLNFPGYMSPLPNSAPCRDSILFLQSSFQSKSPKTKWDNLPGHYSDY